MKSIVVSVVVAMVAGALVVSAAPTHAEEASPCDDPTIQRFCEAANQPDEALESTLQTVLEWPVHASGESTTTFPLVGTGGLIASGPVEFVAKYSDEGVPVDEILETYLALAQCKATLYTAAEYDDPAFSLVAEEESRASFSISQCYGVADYVESTASVIDRGSKPFSTTVSESDESGQTQIPGPARALAKQHVDNWNWPWDWHGPGSAIEWHMTGTVRYKVGHIPAEERFCEDWDWTVQPEIFQPFGEMSRTGVYPC